MLYEARGTTEQRPYILSADVVGWTELPEGTYLAGRQDHEKRTIARMQWPHTR